MLNYKLKQFKRYLSNKFIYRSDFLEEEEINKFQTQTQIQINQMQIESIKKSIDILKKSIEDINKRIDSLVISQINNNIKFEDPFDRRANMLFNTFEDPFDKTHMSFNNIEDPFDKTNISFNKIEDPFDRTNRSETTPMKIREHGHPYFELKTKMKISEHGKPYNRLSNNDTIYNKIND
jgi:hypothetical protein